MLKPREDDTFSPLHDEEDEDEVEDGEDDKDDKAPSS